MKTDPRFFTAASHEGFLLASIAKSRKHFHYENCAFFYDELVNYYLQVRKPHEAMKLLDQAIDYFSEALTFHIKNQDLESACIVSRAQSQIIAKQTEVIECTSKKIGCMGQNHAL